MDYRPTGHPVVDAMMQEGCAVCVHATWASDGRRGPMVLCEKRVWANWGWRHLALAAKSYKQFGEQSWIAAVGECRVFEPGEPQVKIW